MKRNLILESEGIKNAKTLAVLIALGRNKGIMATPDLQKRLDYKEIDFKNIVNALEQNELIKQNPGNDSKPFNERKYKLTIGSVIILERLQNKFPNLLAGEFNFS